jgi:hypothetical protein
MVTEVLVDIGSLGTAAGVFFTAKQLLVSRRQFRTQFKDGLTARYRELVRELPIEVFLDPDVTSEEIRVARGTF